MANGWRAFGVNRSVSTKLNMQPREELVVLKLRAAAQTTFSNPKRLGSNLVNMTDGKIRLGRA